MIAPRYTPQRSVSVETVERDYVDTVNVPPEWRERVTSSVVTCGCGAQSPLMSFVREVGRDEIRWVDFVGLPPCPHWSPRAE